MCGEQLKKEEMDEVASGNAHVDHCPIRSIISHYNDEIYHKK